MKKSYNTEQTKKCKTDFISGKLPDPFCVNHEVAASWQRCMNLGLDQNCDKLPEPSISSVESILIGRALYNYREWLSGFLGSESAVCKMLRCVSVNLDSNMNVLSLLGDEDLVERLAEEANLKEGSNLAESVAGTNAVALAHRHGKECWVFGEEHFISALSNYVTVSNWLSPSATSNFTSYGSMFIIPLEHYKDCLKTFFHFLSTTRETFKLCQQTPLHIMRGMLSDLYLQNVPIGYLIIDREGAILEYNEFAFNLIGERSCALPSDYLQECYPKLAFVKEYIKNNTQRYSSIVYINETVGSIKVDVHPMVGGQQEASGAIILVTSPGFVPFKSPVSPDGSALKRRARFPPCAVGSKSVLSAWTRLARVTPWPIFTPSSPAKKHIHPARKISWLMMRSRSICWWIFRRNCRLARALAMSVGPRFLISSRWRTRSITLPSIICWSTRPLPKKRLHPPPDIMSCLLNQNHQ